MSLIQWLSRYRAFVGSEKITSDSLSGRSLGPASGTLWEVFPFMAPCAFTGLFAGLSISGFDPSTENVRLLEYRNRHRFRPVMDGPFAGTGWQNMTCEDWVKLDPTVFMPIPNIPIPANQPDLRLALDEAEFTTSDPGWNYRQRELSSRYLLHCWSHPDGLVVTAVCFTSCSETNRPFLRPCYAVDPGAAIDPTCLFPHRRMARLFGGLTVLTAGDEITLDAVAQTDSADDRNSLVLDSDEKEPVSPEMTVISVAKNRSPRSRTVRTFSGIASDSGGNISFATTGSHKITRQYAEIDTDTGHVTLVPHTLYLLSREEPCCSCDDYVADYERVRELFDEHEEMIGRYNELYKQLAECREKLKARISELAKLVRLRIDKTEYEDDGIRTEIMLIYTNVREVEHEHRRAVISLFTKSGSFIIRSVKLIQHPRDTEYNIVGISGASIELSSLRSPPLSRLAAV